MRVSSLSDPRVQAVIATYFVPVWHSRDAYQLADPSKEDEAELRRIDRERDRRGLPGGTVCVFLLAPDGRVAASLPVQQAYQPEKLVPFLEKFISDESLQPRDPQAVQATRAGSRAAKPKPVEGGLVLHTWARYEANDPNRGTSQDWVALTTAEWKSLLPRGDAVGASKRVPRDVTDKLCARCYPPGPYWSVKDSKVLASRLTATLIGRSVQGIHVKLEGALELIHPAEGKETDRHVKARLLGYLRYEAKSKAITSFALASVEAESVWSWQGRPQVNKMLFAVAKEPDEARRPVSRSLSSR